MLAMQAKSQTAHSHYGFPEIRPPPPPTLGPFPADKMEGILEAIVASPS